jgi:NADPH:quinone reductase-like Zn-dependent oxidoreductase
MYKTTYPHILGSEFSGDVVEIEPGVSGVMAGDKVLIYPGITDGTCKYCLAGDESICENFRIVGLATDGGYAEYAKVPASNVFPIPNGISYVEAAAIPLVCVTAWHMLVTRAKLRVGEKVLIQAAGSGIGSAAVQIAKLAGATVFATAGSSEKLAKAKELGADYIINYGQADFTKEVLALTNGEGVDVVFEHVGASTFTGSVECLAKGGRLVVAGATSGADVQINLRQIYNRQLSIIGSMLGTRRELVDILKLAGEGKLIPVIDRILPLSEAAEAHLLLGDRKQFGKIVLTI